MIKRGEVVNIQLLENGSAIRAKFVECFVMTWDEFHVRKAQWIAELAARNYAIDRAWYDHSLMWDRMSPELPSIPFREALAFLRVQKGNVRFLSDVTAYGTKRRLLLADCEYIGFAAEWTAGELADLIEEEWFESYRLGMQDCYNPYPVLPEELYVFDPDMTWCVVFTHETTDWESELDDPMKAAESRYCLISKTTE